MANATNANAPHASTSAESGTSTSRVAQSARPRAPENVIRPAPRRRAARATSEHAARTERPITAAREPGATQDGEGADAERQHAVPEAVRRHFVQVENKFYFQDGALAFTDRQHKLTTRSENTQLIADLVSVAKARGWERIAVSGTERFRREAWMAAQHEGLAVSGYKPSQFEQARWVRMAARQHDVGEPGEAAQRAAPRAHVIRSTDHARVVSGRLADHGAATYQHDPHEPMSYFVRIETAKGEQTVWGVDLERALRESLSQPKNGDEVVLRAVGRDAVMVKRPAGSDGVAEKTAHRNRWSIETKVFLNERQRIAAVLRDASIPAVQGARQQPELVGAYMQVRAAELAAQQFRERSERERFVAMVRSALADAVARGEVLPKTQLRAEAKPIDRTERFRMERER